MKRILYIMNESWFWIKQRPHFIAEHLAKHYRMKIYCEKRYTNRVSNEIPPDLRINEIFKFPFAKNFAVKYANKTLHRNILFKKYFKNISEEYDIIWINSPKHFSYIKKFIGDSQTVIYDCMDDILEFRGSRKTVKEFNRHFFQEKELYDRSNIIFCSSETLTERLAVRYGRKENIFVVNNAVYLDDSDKEKEEIDINIKNVFGLNKKTLCYVGTISDWFDFDILIRCLDEFEETGIVLVGPSEVEIPKHERLYGFGPVSHRSVTGIMKMSDALIMPFRVTELIKGVNPVKLYEYIYSCTPSISISYAETERFRDYVYLYSNYDELRKYIDMLTKSNLMLKDKPEKYIDFAMQNTWESRIKEIINHINRINA